MALATGLGDEPQCGVELTEIRTGGQDWWTLGFEATGPADLLRSELQAAATLVFAQAAGRCATRPGRIQLLRDWLRLRPGAGSDADA